LKAHPAQLTFQNAVTFALQKRLFMGLAQGTRPSTCHARSQVGKY